MAYLKLKYDNDFSDFPDTEHISCLGTSKCKKCVKKEKKMKRIGSTVVVPDSLVCRKDDSQPLDPELVVFHTKTSRIKPISRGRSKTMPTSPRKSSTVVLQDPDFEHPGKKKAPRQRTKSKFALY
eukprot:TRINITY_DN45586_c0_g2_i1.p1 TRINITY_DN45586_c0_g2~~TRINITY_DN45586_c0_g2_i1.p1  ORF type:complete len:125 (-),score=7.09 TRINITY_DN45586_c0_g2_i1:125-499(-)